MGAISNENGNSKEWKLVMHGYKILHGGDLNETLQFWRAWGETSHAWLQNPFFIYERNDLVDWIWFDFSQKLTSWVFNDHPCECADVGHSRTIGRAAKMAWKKKLLRIVIPDRYCDSVARIRFYLHKEFRAAGIRFLSTQRIGAGDLEENGHFL